MKRLARILLALAACFVAVLGLGTPASGAIEPYIAEDDKCVYVPEDWNGYEWTFYCPETTAEKWSWQGPYYNGHAPYFVNWDQKADNATGKKTIGGVEVWSGDPCPRPQDDRGNCLNDFDDSWTGIGEWMRGQDNPGILDPKDDLHLLNKIHDDPCVILTALIGEADIYKDPDRLKNNCYDIRKTNPCNKIPNAAQKDSCNNSHPWFEWVPPDPMANADHGCKYTWNKQTGKCADTQLVGTNKAKAPLGVVKPIADGFGVIVVVVFVAGAVGLLLHLFWGIQAYRGGDTVSEVFGRMTWTLLACAGATSVTSLVWTVMG